MNYSLDKQKEITEKIIELIKNSKLLLEYDLAIFEAILKKYDFRTIPNAAKETGKSKVSLYNKVNDDTFCGYKIDNVPFAMVRLLKNYQ